MEKQRKCPACGALVQADAEKCQVCGLEGLNQLFLDRAAYEKWTREVLIPRKMAMAPKVFAGREFGLILTVEGNLYGIGKNSAGQIDEQGDYSYSQLHLMAKDVISAAAGVHYSIYVTRDGTVHLRGRGELAERFIGFSDAEAVYADDLDSFWIQTRKGEIYGFGNNQFVPRQTRTWKKLDRETCVVHYGYREKWISGHPDSPPLWGDSSRVHTNDRYARYRELDMAIESSDAYRKAVQIFGGERVHLVRNDWQSVDIPAIKAYDEDDYPRDKGWNFEGEVNRYESAKRFTCSPEIQVSNAELYDPVPCPDSLWMKDTPHRNGSKPVRPETWEEWSAPRDMLKVAGGKYRWLCLRKDGSVLRVSFWDADGEPDRLDWLRNPVGDLAVCGDFAILSCVNGDILWSRYGSSLKTGEMFVCRLPEEE